MGSLRLPGAAYHCSRQSGAIVEVGRTDNERSHRRGACGAAAQSSPAPPRPPGTEQRRLVPERPPSGAPHPGSKGAAALPSPEGSPFLQHSSVWPGRA
mmetsp:Transcript_36365/g.91836  ORF Transcript_36365/g.91836 Transcript_36365/m.91836 type:complete len:98 (+) Transcript_36365:1974-2267(+)